MKNSNFALVIDSSTFVVESNNLIGVIYFKHDEFSFPRNAWYDFALVILSWWVDAVNQLVKNKRKEIEFLFMEGPLRMDIRFLPPENLEIKYISRHRGGETIERLDIIPIRDFLEEIIKTSEKVIEICNNLNFFSRDRINLEQHLKKLKSIQG